MKRALLVLAILVLVILIGLASFVSGYLYRVYDFTSDAQMEDYALTNILATIANKEFFSTNAPDNIGISKRFFAQIGKRF